MIDIITAFLLGAFVGFFYSPIKHLIITIIEEVKNFKDNWR